jgi:hypothetical protein
MRAMAEEERLDCQLDWLTRTRTADLPSQAGRISRDGADTEALEPASGWPFDKCD